MASVDGARSANQASDNCAKLQCDVCEQDGLKREATKFCGLCEEYMCTQCSTKHRAFKQMRDHEVVSIGDVNSGDDSASQTHSVSYCTKHVDKLVDLFCGKHDKMLCESCRLLRHKQCEIVSIHEKATSSTTGCQLAAALTSMTDNQSKIRRIHNSREKDIGTLNLLRTSCIGDINRSKAKLVDLAEQLEREMLDEVESVIEKRIDVLHEHIRTCEIMLPQITPDIEAADEAKRADNGLANILVAHKLREMEAPLQDLEEKETQNVTDMSFQQSPMLSDLFINLDRLGTLRITPDTSAHPGTACQTNVLIADMNVESSTTIDVHSEWVPSSAILPDGRVVLADQSYRQVILLDELFSIKSSLELPGTPIDIAVDTDNTAVVSIPGQNKLQWLMVGAALGLGQSITTDMQCYGVAVYKGDIYTIGVKPCATSGHVCVIDRSGTVLRQIGVDARGNDMFADPYYITIGAEGHVYLSDCSGNGSVKCYTNTGAVVYDVKFNRKCKLRGMFVDDDGSLLVCCIGSNEIRVLNKDGSDRKVLLSAANGIVNPISVSYRRPDKTLIVTMENTPSVVAFTLK